jgi:hypothetical protein
MLISIRLPRLWIGIAALIACYMLRYACYGKCDAQLFEGIADGLVF